MYDAFYPGQVWLDTNGNRIQAHGGSLIYLDGVYYWYGENKEKTDKAAGIWHWGVRYYASTDLYNWEDRGLLIPPVTDDPNSSLHPTSMMDRPHIIYNARTKKYVCWLKIMEKDQTQTETVLTADSFFGPYTIVREKLRPLGMSAGDFDLAVAPDGKAYYFFERVHSETIIADLTEDYTDVTGYYSTHFPHKGPPHVREATAHFIRHGKHYLLTSGTTGYFPNPSEAAMADTWHGPYTVQGDPHIGDKTKTSFHSQISSVFKVPNKKDLYIACADRWMPNAPDYDYTHYGPLYDRLFDPDVEKTPADWALLANLPQEDVKVMDCKTWDEMVAFMKSVSPKDGVGVMAYTLSKRAMNYYTSLKAVELGKRGIRVNALLPGSTDTGMKKEFEKMAGGQDNLVKENGGAGRLATPQEMADPLLFLNSGMAAFVSGLLLIADMGHNCEKTLGFCKNQLDVPAALKLYNTKFFQNKLKTNQ